MFGAIGYNLVNVVNFNGRQTARQFWPYAIFLFVASFAGMTALMAPELAASMQRMEQFALEHPELATVERGPGHYSISIEGNHPELMPDFMIIIRMTGILGGAIVVLLAAAVSRRLHDRGKSAAWGMLPLPFLVFAFLLMPRLFSDFGQGAPNLGLFFALFGNNLLYLASLAYLIVLLCGQTTRGENRFGPPPTGR